MSTVSASVLYTTVALLLQSRPAQANPLMRLAPPQNRTIAQDQSIGSQAALSFNTPLPPESAIGAPVAAVSRITESGALQFPAARSRYGEADLIQNLSNESRVAPAGITPAPLLSGRPVFVPPGLIMPNISAPPRVPRLEALPTGSRPLLVTGANNSAVELSLQAAPGVVPSRPEFGFDNLRENSATAALKSQPSPPLLSSQSPAIAPVAAVRAINPSGMPTIAAASSPALLETPLTLPSQKSTWLTQSGNSNADALMAPSRPLLRNTALSQPKFTLQGVYLYQGDQTSARARLTIAYPLTPRVLVGASLDLATGNAFTDTREEGFSVNELYVATSLADIPNLRFVVGQIDLTSYFDRNSFAKDGATHFFNAAFQTNPALSAAGLSSRPGLLFNWALTDNIEAKAAAFSSARGLSDFALDGFAGELGIRYGNAIIRGTYLTDRESGTRDGFGEVFQLARGNNQFGVLKGDREESYGINAEVFIPQLKMGIFGRFGRYNNRDLDAGGDTYSAGVTFLDLFTPDDRLGIGYGRGLSNDNLRRDRGDRTPDVLEAFYDFRFLPNLRIGFSVQERNDFSEVIAGIRVKTEFDVTPKGKLVR